MAELMIFAPSKGGDSMGKMADKEGSGEGGGPKIDAARVLMAAIKSGNPGKLVKAWEAMAEACPMKESEAPEDGEEMESE